MDIVLDVDPWIFLLFAGHYWGLCQFNPNSNCLKMFVTDFLNLLHFVFPTLPPCLSMGWLGECFVVLFVSLEY